MYIKVGEGLSRRKDNKQGDECIIQCQVGIPKSRMKGTEERAAIGEEGEEGEPGGAVPDKRPGPTEAGKGHIHQLTQWGKEVVARKGLWERAGRRRE